MANKSMAGTALRDERDARGVTVPDVAVRMAGAVNAGLLAAAILATSDPDLALRLEAYREAQTASVAEGVDPQA